LQLDFRVLDGIQQILDSGEAYWLPEPLSANCTPPQTAPLSMTFASRNVPLATIALYDDMETMHCDLDRFDLRGLAGSGSLLHMGGLHTAELLDRLPEGTTIGSLSLLFAYRSPDEEWKRLVAHELVHALQFLQWDVSSTAAIYPYVAFLQEGTARYSEHALGFLEDFALRSAGPVSIWLAEGLDLRKAPEFLLYGIGASIVDALVRRRPPDVLWSALSGPCRSAIKNWFFASWFSCDAAFADAYGLSWDAFLDAWSSEAAAVVPPTGAELVYRWLHDAYGLRSRLLEPLLSAEVVDWIDRVEEAIYAGMAEPSQLDELDDILRAASGQPTPDVFEALHEREATVIDYARERAGAVGQVAEVLRLGILARRGDVAAEEYVRAFVDVVNVYVPIAVQQPMDR